MARPGAAYEIVNPSTGEVLSRRLEVALPSSLLTTTSEKEESVANVVIGVVPHKRLNAVVVINGEHRPPTQGGSTSS